MSEYNWYKIFNLTEFTALSLVSKSYEYDFETLGLREILVTKGNTVGVVFDDVFLSLGLVNDEGYFAFEDRAVFLQTATQDVYVGVKIES